MATKQEFQSAFDITGKNIIVRSKTGKEYWINIDQIGALPNNLICGVPVKPHPRRQNHVYWLMADNVTITQ